MKRNGGPNEAVKRLIVGTVFLPFVVWVAGCADAPTPTQLENATRGSERTVSGKRLAFIPDQAIADDQPSRVVWVLKSPNGTRSLFRPEPGAMRGARIRALGYHPGRVEFRLKALTAEAVTSRAGSAKAVSGARGKAAAGPMGAFAPQAAKLDPLGDSPNPAAVAVCYPNCILADASLYYSGGSLRYGTIMKTTDPSISTMVAKIIETSDEAGNIPNPNAIRQQVPGPGTWQTEFLMPQSCNPHGEYMTVMSAHWGMSRGGGINTEIDQLGGWTPCPSSPGGGSGGGDGEDLFVDDGPVGSWMCREYNLEGGIYHVYVDGSYSGSINCDS